MRKNMFIPIAIFALTFSACNSSQSESPISQKVENNDGVAVVQSVKTENNASETANETEPAPTVTAKELKFLSKYEKNIKVKGSADISGFTKSLLVELYSSYYNWDNVDECEVQGEMNKKAGYFSMSQEGDGPGCSQTCCYWVRDDKKKLVAFYDRCGDTHLWFFLYNEATKELEPIEAPINAPLEEGSDIYCALPEKGLDIEYLVYSGDVDWVNVKLKTLQWNGMSFDKLSYL